MTKPDELAFPLVDNVQTGQISPGLTKREYFAAMYIAGINTMHPTTGHEALIAKNAVAMADALIAALNKEGGSK